MRIRGGFVLGLVIALLGCETEPERRPERDAIESTDMPALRQIAAQDIERLTSGTAEAADLLSGGFVVEDLPRREREMRSVMRRMRQPPRAISNLMTSPISFIAAVDLEGIVIARDMDPDPMRGFNLAELAPVVAAAIRGEAGHGIALFPADDPAQPASAVVLFAAPSRREGQVVGVVVTGLPLWRVSQQMTNQLQLDNADRLTHGLLLWVLLYQGEVTHPHGGFPPDLETLAPDDAERTAGLRGHEQGYTGQVQQFGRSYGYGVVPLPELGEGVGAVVFRSDAP